MNSTAPTTRPAAAPATTATGDTAPATRPAAAPATTATGETAPTTRPAAAPAIVASHRPSRIDLCGPATTTAMLDLDESGVVALVNAGRLAAYRIDGAIRFRIAEVEACRQSLVAA